MLRDWACCPILNIKNGLSITNGVQLYKQFVCLIIDYTCTIWRPTTRTLVTKLQLLQSKHRCVAACANLYTGNRKIEEESGVLFFAEHIRTLTEIYDSDLAGAGNPYFGNSADTYADRGLTQFHQSAR
jgi:hypothetical protein